MAFFRKQRNGGDTADLERYEREFGDAQARRAKLARSLPFGQIR